MKFSCFKRDFLGAPIRRALKSLAAGKEVLRGLINFYRRRKGYG